jgi:hypothetical protein
MQVELRAQEQSRLALEAALAREELARQRSVVECEEARRAIDAAVQNATESIRIWTAPV